MLRVYFFFQKELLLKPININVYHIDIESNYKPPKKVQNDQIHLPPNFSKCSFRNTIRVSNSFDPDQDRHSVGPDLCPNCLQRLSADNTS